jgi:NAD(P)-dependent dehydrogenase (short-subunit alcohol dehydrogenase family)
MTARTTVVLGPDLPWVAELADKLGASRDVGRPHDVAVIAWSLPRTAGLEQSAVDALEGSLLEGLARFHQVATSSSRPDRLRRIVNVVQPEAAGTWSATLSAAVGGLTKSWARELARDGTTVNAAGADSALAQSVDVLADAVAYLSHESAGYVTGQTLGTVGERLARPRPGPAGATGPGRVLVSGGAGEIGAAIVRRLHADGHHMVVGYVREAAARALCADLDPSGRTCSAIPLDVSDRQRVLDGLGELAAGPPLTGLVICGGWNRTARFWDTEPDEWRKTVAINLSGPARLIAGLVTPLGQAGGCVVGIGSESGRVGDAGRSVYAGAKAGLSRLLSEIPPTHPGLRCATVSPGPVDTPLMRSTHGGVARAEHGIERLRQLVPLRRLGLPEEIAHGVGYAFSARGGCLNGEVLSIGGGITMQ